MFTTLQQWVVYLCNYILWVHFPDCVLSLWGLCVSGFQAELIYVLQILYIFSPMLLYKSLLFCHDILLSLYKV
jgi:hypothetical protein